MARSALILWAALGLGCTPVGEESASETSTSESPVGETPDVAASNGAAAPAECPPPEAVGEGPHRVALVVSFTAQRHLARCIAFEEPQLSAFEILGRSGLEVQSQFHVAYNSHTLCRLSSDDGWSQGCDYPNADCFCDPDGAFWSFWRPAEGGWTKSQLGLDAAHLGPGELFSQHWSALEGRPPSCTYDDICPSPVDPSS
jgi:hypothetical protein